MLVIKLQSPFLPGQAINTKHKQEYQLLGQKVSWKKVPKFSWSIKPWENKSSFLGLWMFTLMGQTIGLCIIIIGCLSRHSEECYKWFPSVYPITGETTEYVINAMTEILP